MNMRQNILWRQTTLLSRDEKNVGGGVQCVKNNVCTCWSNVELIWCQCWFEDFDVGMAEQWGWDVVVHSSRWNAILTWLNWLVQSNDDSHKDRIGVKYVLEFLSNPLFLDYLLQFHDVFSSSQRRPPISTPFHCGLQMNLSISDLSEGDLTFANQHDTTDDNTTDDDLDIVLSFIQSEVPYSRVRLSESYNVHVLTDCS